MIPYNIGNIDFFYQFDNLFENRLSDKFYFTIFTHVVMFFSQNQFTTLKGNRKGVPSFF